jgi:abequosyltransferase
MKNNKLSIAIPTYNRAEMLEYNLLQIIDELLQYNIPVYISDDSTNEETEKCIRKMNEKYGLFHYKKNEIRMGHDLNCLHTLSLPVENYVWYMGDSMIIKKGSIEKVLSYIDSDVYDFISCNADGRFIDVGSKVFNDGVVLFETLCWHLTMTGSTIYNKNKLFDLANFDISKFKNFPQTAIIFEQFATKKSQLFWTNEKLIYSNQKKNSYWASKVFEVFIDDFRSFLYNLSDYYTLKSKDKVLLQHSVQTGIFNFPSFVLYRMEGFYDYKIFKKYQEDFHKITNTSPILLLILSIVWIKPLSIIYLFIRKTILIFRN